MDVLVKKGLGSLELETPHQIELYRDQLYVNDEYSGKLVTFDKDGKAQGSVRFNFFADFQFSIYKDKIFTYNSALDGGNVHPIAIYDIKAVTLLVLLDRK